MAMLGEEMTMTSLRRAIAAAFTALLISASAAAQDHRELYERARLLDESNRSLDEAIALYERVVEKAEGDRALAARSQFRIGVLHDRLGRREEARKAYRAVIANFPDQTEIVRRARGRLAEPGDREPAPLIRRTGPSADGTYLETFTIPQRTNVIMTVDAGRRRLYAVTVLSMAEPEERGGKTKYIPSNLIVIDLDSHAVVRTLPLQVYVNEMAFNPANGKLYTAAQVDHRVRVIDTNSLAIEDIEVAGFPTGVAVNPATNRIYVTCQGFGGNDKLFVIDGTTHRVSEPHDLGGVTGWVTVNPTTNRVYVAGSPKTRIFSGTGDVPAGELAGYGAMVADVDHNRLYGSTTSAVFVLDGNTHEVTASFPLTPASGGFGVDPRTERLYVSLAGRNQIAVIDVARSEEVGRFTVGANPTNIAVDPVTGHVYVSHQGERSTIGVLAGRKVHGDLPREFIEEFDAPVLDSAWSIHPADRSVSLTEKQGTLRMRVHKPGSERVRMMRRFRGDRWTIDVRAKYSMATSGGMRAPFAAVFFGLAPPLSDRVIDAVPLDGVRIYRTREDWNGCCPGVVTVHFTDGGRVAAFFTFDPAPSESYVWRIRRDGRTVSVEWSENGVDFRHAGSHMFGSYITGVIQGFALGFDSYSETDAHVDYESIVLRHD